MIFCREYEMAKSIPEMMTSANVMLNRITYRNLLINDARRGDIDAIVTTLQKYHNEGVALYDEDVLRIIFECAVNGHAAHVDPLFDCLLFTTGFNTDAHIFVLQLLNSSQDEVAFKLLRKMRRSHLPNGELNDTGNFFIRQLVKLKRPIEHVIGFCERMIETGLNQHPYTTMMYAVSYYENSKNGLDLLRRLRSESRLNVEDNDFKVLFRKARSPEEVSMLLKALIYEFKLPVKITTLSNYVIESLGCKNKGHMLRTLRELNVPKYIAVGAIIYYYLDKQDLKTAADFTTYYKFSISSRKLRESAIPSLLLTNDIDSYVKLIAACKNKFSHNANSFDNVECEEIVEIFGHTLEALAERSRNATIVELLTKSVQEGITVSATQETRIRAFVKSGSISEEVDDLLRQLCSDTDNAPLSSYSQAQLEEMIANTDSVEQKHAYQIQSMHYYRRSSNLAAFENVLQQLASEKVDFDNSNLAKWLTFFIDRNDAYQLIETYKKAKAMRPEFNIGSNRMLCKAVIVLSESGHIDDALQLLAENRRDPMAKEASVKDRRSPYANLVNHLSEKLDISSLTRFIDALVQHGYIFPQENLAGVLANAIKNQLERENIAGALDLFEKFIDDYKCIAARHELACQLIKRKDFAALDRMIAAMQRIRNEKSCLTSMMFSYIQCGEIVRAQRMLEELRLNTNELNQLSGGFARLRNYEALEQLLAMTKEINRTDNQRIWLDLLDIYSMDSSSTRALDLWVRMQESGYVPFNAFLDQLARFITSLGEPVPFWHSSSMRKS